MDSLAREKEAKAAVERLQTSLSEELRSAQSENSIANQKVRQREQSEFSEITFSPFIYLKSHY